MSGKPLAAVTALAAVMMSAAPAEAGLFGRKKTAPAAAPAPAAETRPERPSFGKKSDVKSPAPAPQAAEGPPAPPRRASAEERAAAERMEPLARVAFWSREHSLDLRDAQAGIALSSALRAMSRNGEAAEAAKRVLALHPDNVDALVEHARAEIAQNQGFYAIEPLRKAQGLAPRDWRLPSLLGVAFEQVGRGADAQAAWALALKLSPENPAVLANMALSKAANRDLPGAEALLRRAAAQKGASVKVRQNLVLVLGLQGKLQEAERLAREDLPPEIADANLDWLRSASVSGPRSWDALRGANAAN